MLLLRLLMLYLICVFGKIGFSVAEINFRPPLGLPQPDVCSPGPKGRVPWILYVRDSDYGWREHTHRAMIALAVNDYNEDEIRKMNLQLEVELARALFRNKTDPIHETDLALYIHALLATKKNPRNFHGIDLVADLLHRVENWDGDLNPFLVLALCNAHAIKYTHLERISNFVTRAHSESSYTNHSYVDSRIVQKKALAYKALACARKYHPEHFKFHSEMTAIANCLKWKYNDETGSFGNVFTTSLAVQAFTAYPPQSWWKEEKSLQYLLGESEIDVNLIKAYYIEMTLNARTYNFIRDLYDGVPQPAVVPRENSFYVQYTVKTSHYPDQYSTLTLKVENGTNFYEIMKIASKVSAVFNFTMYEDSYGNPMVYAVAGIPNDIEENMFWRLCIQWAVEHNHHTSIIQSYDMSPVTLIPRDGDHFLYLYSNTDCPPGSFLLVGNSTKEY